MISFGVLLALGSLLGWGFGDFLIQKTTRRVGITASIAFEAVLAILVLFPFALPEFKLLLQQDARSLLVLLSACILLGVLCSRRALKNGKLSVIVPIISLELPLTVGLSLALANERLTPPQALFILLIIAGVLLVALRERVVIRGRKIWLERGTLIALLAAIFLSLSSFLSGVASRRVSPMLTIWFIEFGLAFASVLILLGSRRFLPFLRASRTHFKILTIQTVCTTGAWICFVFATTHIPISIATAISEGYIALASVLGIVFNKEKIKKHQIAGLMILVLGITLLALFT